MSNKDLKYFMRGRETEIVKVPAPSSFRDENGEVIQLEINKLTQEEINNINDKYHQRSMATDKKGSPLTFNGEVIWKEERDNVKAGRHILVEALQYPNLKDPELMKFYGVVDVTDMPLKVFASVAEYQHVTRVVMQALGLSQLADDEEDLAAAKN